MRLIGAAVVTILTRGTPHVLAWCVVRREVVGSAACGQGRSSVAGASSSSQALTRGATRPDREEVSAES